MRPFSSHTIDSSKSLMFFSGLLEETDRNPKFYMPINEVTLEGDRWLSMLRVTPLRSIQFTPYWLSQILICLFRLRKFSRNPTYLSTDHMPDTVEANEPCPCPSQQSWQTRNQIHQCSSRRADVEALLYPWRVQEWGTVICEISSKNPKNCIFTNKSACRQQLNGFIPRRGCLSRAANTWIASESFSVRQVTHGDLPSVKMRCHK